MQIAFNSKNIKDGRTLDLAGGSSSRCLTRDGRFRIAVWNRCRGSYCFAMTRRHSPWRISVS